MENEHITTYQPSESVNPSPTSGDTRKYVIIGVAVALVILILLVAGIVVLATAPDATVAKVRDIFIIFMALVSLLLGLVLVLLVVQIARLTNLLQNEIKPILESTNETVSTLRGTTAFISDNLVQPVIKLNEYMAAFQEVLGVIGLARRKHKNP